MKMLMCVFVILLFSIINAGPTHPGEMSAIICISSQNLQNYAEKIALLVSQDKIPVGDKKLNKFMSCHWKNKGLLDDNGNIHADNLKSYLENIFANGSTISDRHKEIASNIVEHCKTTGGKNPGQNAVIVQNCIAAYLFDYE